MIAAMVTAGFLGYYVSGSINLKETHVRNGQWWTRFRGHAGTRH